jgi:alanine dehydrogenase
MVIGVPKEIKPDEYRVAMTPSGVEVLTQHGHTVLIERGAGDGTGIPDCEYEAAGRMWWTTPRRCGATPK